MEDPTRDITAVIKSLTQGSREEQERTINTYFLPNAYFIHPLCRVPPFAFGGIDTSSAKSLGSSKKGSRQQQQQAVASPDPDGKQGPLNSRYLVQLVYQWYKILSPQIDIVVDSAAFDAKAGLLYVTMRQTFTIWVVPLSLWQAKVKLVTVLELAELPAAASDGKKKKQQQQQQGGSSTEESQGQINGTHADEGPAEVKLEGEDGETMPSFAAVAAPGPTPEHHNTTFHPSTMVNGDGGSHDDEDDSGEAREEEEKKKVYYIKGQEDHYQVDQWLKFISPFGPLWFLFQLFATLLCTLGVAALWPVTVVVDSRKQKQGQENRGRRGSKEKRG